MSMLLFSFFEIPAFHVSSMKHIPNDKSINCVSEWLGDLNFMTSQEFY